MLSQFYFKGVGGNFAMSRDFSEIQSYERAWRQVRELMPEIGRYDAGRLRVVSETSIIADLARLG